jgi:hypothetical protein
VDDVGLVLIWNGKGVKTALQCEWSSEGNHGFAAGDLQPHLTVGDNYIIFILYNKVYDPMVLCLDTYQSNSAQKGRNFKNDKQIPIAVTAVPRHS